MKKSINYWSFVGKDIYQAMDLAKAAGFEGIELALMAEGDLTPESTDEQLAKIRAYAEKIGIKLKEISDTAQVLCITHSPQIASLADTHLLIRKKVTDSRAESEIEELDESGRVSEIARIIGGVSVTETQRDAAREMIENNQ